LRQPAVGSMPRQKPITIEAAQTFGVLLHVKPPPALQ
jgi:hypothetical protein